VSAPTEGRERRWCHASSGALGTGGRGGRGTGAEGGEGEAA
jgi:hypothetical protein